MVFSAVDGDVRTCAEATRLVVADPLFIRHSARLLSAAVVMTATCHRRTPSLCECLGPWAGTGSLGGRFVGRWRVDDCPRALGARIGYKNINACCRIINQKSGRTLTDAWRSKFRNRNRKNNL